MRQGGAKKGGTQAHVARRAQESAQGSRCRGADGEVGRGSAAPTDRADGRGWKRTDGTVTIRANKNTQRGDWYEREQGERMSGMMGQAGGMEFTMGMG